MNLASLCTMSYNSPAMQYQNQRTIGQQKQVNEREWSECTMRQEGLVKDLLLGSCILCDVVQEPSQNTLLRTGPLEWTSFAAARPLELVQLGILCTFRPFRRAMRTHCHTRGLTRISPELGLTSLPKLISNPTFYVLRDEDAMMMFDLFSQIQKLTNTTSKKRKN